MRLRRATEYRQGADKIALTKLDVLSHLDSIPVCVAYEIDGKRVDEFPGVGEALNLAKPVIECVPGWKCDISGCRSMDELPREAADYIRFIEKLVGQEMWLISVGGSEAYFTENKNGLFEKRSGV